MIIILHQMLMLMYLLVIKYMILIIFKMIGMEMEYKGYYESENKFIDKDLIMVIKVYV